MAPLQETHPQLCASPIQTAFCLSSQISICPSKGLFALNITLPLHYSTNCRSSSCRATNMTCPDFTPPQGCQQTGHPLAPAIPQNLLAGAQRQQSGWEEQELGSHRGGPHSRLGRPRHLPKSSAPRHTGHCYLRILRKLLVGREGRRGGKDSFPKHLPGVPQLPHRAPRIEDSKFWAP